MDYSAEKLTGDQLLFYIDGQALACEISCDFSYTHDMKQVSPYVEGGGGFQAIIPGIRSWQMSVAANFLTYFHPADFKTILTAMINGTPMTIGMRTNDDYSPAFLIGGTAYNTSGTLSSSGNEIVGYTAVFQGNGPLVFTSEAKDGDFWRIINANPSTDDKPIYYQSSI